ncbi:MAG: hypothetical protein HW400_339 [Candidatus Levybacteria bacterium]|nr:hypothetical protein [Candidatus Levybacteria bacterium]
MEQKTIQKTEVPPLNELRVRLEGVETQAKATLGNALTEAGVSTPVAEQYANLFPESTTNEPTSAPLTLALVGKKSWDDIKHNKLTQLTIGGLLVGTAARVAEAHGIVNPQIPIPNDLIIFLDNLLRWSGSTIKPSANLFSILNAIGNAAVYVGVPVKAIEIITALQNRRTIEQVRKNAELMRIRAEKEQDIKEGEANFDGKVGSNIQIDVGKSDPAMKDLLTLFHATGLRVVSYWDSENHFFNIDPAWQKTSNDWTNRETLKRGDIREALCSVILVSNGDDVFLSSRRQDPSKQMQDMTDNEAIGTIHARDAVRKDMGLSPIQHILVSNPQRTIEIGIARAGGTPSKLKTVGEVTSKLQNVHLIDPDLLVIRQIAEIANWKDLPIELITNEERKTEYGENLEKVIERYNQLVNSGLEKNKVRLATEDDGENTLSLIYGSTDEDTIAQVTTYGKDFSQHGDLIAIINNPEKISRLPQGVKNICIGRSVADAIYQKFFELVSAGAIKI